MREMEERNYLSTIRWMVIIVNSRKLRSQGCLIGSKQDKTHLKFVNEFDACDDIFDLCLVDSVNDCVVPQGRVQRND